MVCGLGAEGTSLSSLSPPSRLPLQETSSPTVKTQWHKGGPRRVSSSEPPSPPQPHPTATRASRVDAGPVRPSDVCSSTHPDSNSGRDSEPRPPCCILDPPRLRETVQVKTWAVQSLRLGELSLIAVGEVCAYLKQVCGVLSFPFRPCGRALA